jgi:hypothetical protein
MNFSTTPLVYVAHRSDTTAAMLRTAYKHNARNFRIFLQPKSLQMNGDSRFNRELDYTNITK